MNWLIIVNPLAGSGSAGHLWKSTDKKLSGCGIRYTVRFTEARAQTRLIASNALNSGHDAVAVFGGDGTMADAAAAVSFLDNKPVLAFLPAGTGNDWIRSTGFENASIDNCISAMVSEKTKIVDTGLCRWPGGSEFFLNSAGIGFDTLVLKRAVSFRKYLPMDRINYLIALAVSALFPPCWRGTILCDGKPVYKGDYLSGTVGVGKFSGGGMQLSPSAVPDDGLLDVLVLSPMNFFTVAACFPRLFDGTLATIKQATAARGRVLRIEPSIPGSIALELDGEVVVPDSNAEYVEFVSVPDSLRIIVPSE